ncbi:glycosyltransferase family 2 protein [Sphingomonas adhaesiva]|uniref:glycosyltransferase family 2 protein n=1 Tax=Sphingomonas adhaesiva TaxID=28212 RepID=UPI002FF7629D
MNDVLIVIPCLNEEAHLPDLVAGLVADSGGALIVVADGGSTDRSRQIVADIAARHPQVVLLDNPKRIQSAGVNLAVRTHGAGRRWLVRVDAHCGYPRDYVAGLLAAARAQDATSVVVPMVTAAQGCFQQAAAAAQNSVLGNGGSAHRRLTSGQWVDHGHHALFDLALYTRVGGYDEGFSHNEDAELDQRLMAAGGRIWLEPSLALTYWPRTAAGPLFRQYRGYGRGRALNLLRHRTRIKLRQAVPIVVAPAVAAAALGVVLAIVATPWALLLALPALGWAGLCLAYGALLGWRAKSACVAGAGWAAMVMHVAWSLGFVGVHLTGTKPGAPPQGWGT